MTGSTGLGIASAPWLVRSLAARGFVVLLFGMLLATWMACTPNPSEPDREVVAFVSQCQSDDECGERRECLLGVCGVIGASREIALSFTPPEVRADLAPQSVIGVTVVTGSRLPDYALQPAVSVFGQVSFADAPDVPQPELRGVVSLEPARRIPGRVGSVSFFTDNFGRLHQETISGGVLARTALVKLAPGTYDATVLLTRSDGPVRTFRSLSLTGLEAELSLLVPSTDALLRIDGTLEIPQVDAEQLAGAVVSAVTRDGVVSEAVVSANVDGALFSLFVDPDVGEVEFRVSVAEPSINARFEPVSVAALGGDSVQLVLPREPELVPLRVDAVGPLGTRPSGSNTLIWTQSLPTSPTIAASFPGVASGTISQRSPLNLSDGLAIAVVYAGQGEATLVPEDAEFGLPPAEPIFLDGINDPILVFNLPVRQSVFGWLEDPDTGVPLPNTRVSATLALLPDGTRPSFSSGVFGGAAVADETGRFDLFLQPGVYRVFAEPAPNTSSAAGTGLSMEVVEGQDLVWRIPAVRSGVVAGRLLDSAGAPVVGAAVEAWPVDDSSRRPLARVATDSAGEYRLVLPVP